MTRPSPLGLALLFGSTLGCQPPLAERFGWFGAADAGAPPLASCPAGFRPDPEGEAAWS